MANFADIVRSQHGEIESRLRLPYVDRRLPSWALQSSDAIHVVLGPRRAGKSTLAAHWLAKLGGGGYLNFDDERLAGPIDTDHLLAAVDAVHGHPTRLLFDEVQNVPRWELWCNRLQREGRRLILTGSNANLLGSELATHLTGRHQAVVLPPFSFAEVLAAESDSPTAAATAAQRAARFERYLQEGGYPEPLLRGAPRSEYLRDLVRATLLKDVVRRHRLRSPGGLEDLAHRMFSLVGQRFSSRALAQSGGIASPTTAEKYVRHLEEAMLIFTLGRFSFKARERTGAIRKAYAVDPGLAATLGVRAGADWGRLAENAVAIALWRRQLAGDCTVHFWQNAQGEEVDFVVRRQGRTVAVVQVCWHLDDTRTRTREWRALLKAAADLRCERLVCLHHGPAARESVEWHGRKGEIELLPMAEWLAADELTWV
jgi:predicted AAA+ superfamily ATPase